MENTTTLYNDARARYAELGVDTDKAVKILEKIAISIHCWQADDVTGFENTPEITLAKQEIWMNSAWIS